MFTLLKFRLVFYKPILLIDELQQKKPRIYQETKHAHFLQQKKHIFLAFQSSFIFISFQKFTLCDIIVMEYQYHHTRNTQMKKRFYFLSLFL